MERPHNATFSRYPLLWLATSFAAGIACAKHLSPAAVPLAILCVAAAACAAFAYARGAAAPMIVIAFFALGSLCYQLEIDGVAANRVRSIYDAGEIESGEPVAVDGQVLGLPEVSHDGVFVRLWVSRVVYKGRERDVEGEVRIFVPSGGSEAAEDIRRLDLTNGSQIRVACNLQREETFQNPGVRSRVASLDEQGIDAVASIKSPLLIEKIGGDAGFSFTGAILAQRRRLIEECRRLFDAPTAGVLIASMLGDKYFLDKQTADLFRDGGTFHILVISGLHITFIGGLVMLLAAALTRNRLWQFIAATSFLWTYTVAVGAEVPVVRASVVFTILAFSRVVHRQGTLLNSLGACGLLLLAFRPSSLFTPSFQLTFASVGSIVGIAFPLISNLRRIGAWLPTPEEPLPPASSRPLRRICETLYWRDEMWKFESDRQIYSGRLFKRPLTRFRGELAAQKTAAYLVEGLLVSLIVQICLLPLGVYYFHRVSLAGVFLNLWVGAVLAVETFAAAAAVAAGQISETLAGPFAAAAELFNSLLLAFPRAAAGTGWSSMRLPVYPGIGQSIYLLYFVPIVAAGIVIFRWDPFEKITRLASRTLIVSSICVTAAAAIILMHPHSAPTADGKLHVDFLDVGQGDSALVTFPDGETMLIDGGGRADFRNSDDESDADSFEPDVPRIGEAVVSEFLWQKGYSRIDYLVATHADADHIQGLADVAANFDIGEVAVGRAADGDKDYDALVNVVRRKNIPFATVSAGEVLNAGGARIEILNPAAASGSANNDSVVMRIVFGERSFLMTGDIEGSGEAAIIQNNLASDVVKVPHHGSRTSSTRAFIDSTRAAYAVISVGKRSRFGHPHPEVVERWRSAGAEVIRTGESGTVTFVTDGKNLELYRNPGKVNE